MMRYTRRMSPTSNDFTQSSASTPESARRNSVAVFKTERRPSYMPIDQTDDSNLNR